MEKYQARGKAQGKSFSFFRLISTSMPRACVRREAAYIVNGGGAQPPKDCLGVNRSAVFEKAGQVANDMEEALNILRVHGPSRTQNWRVALQHVSNLVQWSSNG